MRLFREKGYREVTMEQIANEADVAPATVYRYFETKTGFFTVDPVEHPGYGERSFAEELMRDPVRALRALVVQIQGEDQNLGIFMGGMSFVIDVPEVRSAVIQKYLQMADDIAGNIDDEYGIPPVKVKAFARSVFISVFTAVEQWHLDGRGTPLEDYIAQACEAAISLSEVFGIQD